MKIIKSAALVLALGVPVAATAACTPDKPDVVAGYVSAVQDNPADTFGSGNQVYTIPESYAIQLCTRSGKPGAANPCTWWDTDQRTYLTVPLGSFYAIPQDEQGDNMAWDNR